MSQCFNSIERQRVLDAIAAAPTKAVMHPSCEHEWRVVEEDGSELHYFKCNTTRWPNMRPAFVPYLT